MTQETETTTGEPFIGKELASGHCDGYTIQLTVGDGPGASADSAETSWHAFAIPAKPRKMRTLYTDETGEVRFGDAPDGVPERATAELWQTW